MLSIPGEVLDELDSVDCRLVVEDSEELVVDSELCG